MDDLLKLDPAKAVLLFTVASASELSSIDKEKRNQIAKAHATLTDLSLEQISNLLTPVVSNPAQEQ